MPTARARPPTIPFLRASGDGFPVAVLRRETYAPVHARGLHAHRFFSVLYADGGAGTLGLAGQRIAIAAGDVHVVPPGEPHDTAELGAVIGWVLEFTADVLDERDTSWGSGLFGSGCGRPRWFGFLRGGHLRAPKITVPPPQRPRFDARFRALAGELGERKLGYQDAARAELSLLLVDLARVAAPEGAPAKLLPLVGEVFAVIDARYQEPISLRHVARHVGRSPSHVTNVVREQTGLTVLEWILERRLDEARRRLRETDEDVAIIAERVGFGSVNHFLRQFRKAHGFSPRAFRGFLTVDRIDKSGDSLAPERLNPTPRSSTRSGHDEDSEDG